MSTAGTATPSKTWTTTEQWVHVVEWETDKSIHVVTCKGSPPHRVESGLNINLNHELYYTKIADCPHKVMDAMKCVLCAAGHV